MLSALFRGLGDSRSPLIFVLVACVVNIVGDLVLVAGFHLDAVGAAIATVAAQAVSVVCAVVMLLKKSLPFSIKKADFRLNFQCKKFLAIGLPLALQEFLTQLSFLALCAFVNRLGLEASSGYGVACKIVNFAMLIPSALMQSMASFISQNIGAGKHQRARQTLRTGIGIGLFFGLFVFALVLCKGDLLCSFFTTDAPVIANGYAYLKGFALETILTAILFSMIGYFNGSGKDRFRHGAGPVPDPARPPAHGLHYEHPAQRQPNHDRPGRPHLHSGGCAAEYLLLPVPEPEGEKAGLKTIHFPDTTKGTAWSTRRPFLLVLSIHHRDIQPKLKGAEAGADIFRDADDRGGQAAADLAGFSQSLAVGQADDGSGKEGHPPHRWCR